MSNLFRKLLILLEFSFENHKKYYYIFAAFLQHFSNKTEEMFFYYYFKSNYSEIRKIYHFCLSINLLSELFLLLPLSPLRGTMPASPPKCW